MNSAGRVGIASAGVVATAFVGTCAIVATHFFSQWNWLWVVGIPLAVTAALFRRSPPWVWPLIFAWLAICSFFVVLLTNQALGFGT
jgi:hypothetical protein